MRHSSLKTTDMYTI